MTLTEPLVLAAVALIILVDGVVTGSVFVGVCGGIGLVFASGAVVVTIRRLNRQAAAWQQLSKATAPADNPADDVKDL